MQKAYLLKLYDLAEKDRNVLHLLADSGTGYDELFRSAFPDQVLDFGIAEENMVGAAAGLASCGKIPFVYTAGAFLAYRSMEFIRDDVCLQKMNVKLVGMGTGLAWSTLGPTHHTTEDLAILRSLPNLVVLTPSCPSMVQHCVDLAYRHKGPVYLRVGMGGESELYEEEYSISLGENKKLRDGTDIAIFASGEIVQDALNAAVILTESGVEADVYDVFSIVPFDEECVMQAAREGKDIVTVEEHSVIGGIGTAVAEVFAKNGLHTDLLKIGIQNGFAKGYGTHDEVKKQNGLDADSIAAQILEWRATK